MPGQAGVGALPVGRSLLVRLEPGDDALPKRSVANLGVVTAVRLSALCAALEVAVHCET
jgi:hypothetical protein